MASSKLRASSSFPSILLSALNLFLFLLSVASLAPVFLLKTRPTSFGWALVTVSSATLLSSLVGFYSQLTHFCFITHISLVLAASIGQLLGFLALFLRPGPCQDLLESSRKAKEVQMLLRIEEGLLLGMFVVQLIVLVAACTVQSQWVKDYEGMETEREESARKRGRKMARVQEESLANAAVMAEEKAKELEEKIRNKHGKWMKNDVQG